MIWKKISIRSIRASTMSCTTTIRMTSQSPILMPQLVFLMTLISRRSKGFSLPKNYSSCAGRRRYPWRPSSGFQVQCSESDEDWRCGTSEEHGCACRWHSSNSFAEHGERNMVSFSYSQGRVVLTNQMNFRKSSKGRGGCHFQSKNLYCRFWGL